MFNTTVHSQGSWTYWSSEDSTAILKTIILLAHNISSLPRHVIFNDNILAEADGTWLTPDATNALPCRNASTCRFNVVNLLSLLVRRLWHGRYVSHFFCLCPSDRSFWALSEHNLTLRSNLFHFFGLWCPSNLCVDIREDVHVPWLGDWDSLVYVQHSTVRT